MPPTHSRTSSIALPTYSSARFKRRFKGILWGIVLVVILTWIGIARHRSSHQEEEVGFREGTKSLYRHFKSNLSSRFTTTRVGIEDVKFEGKVRQEEEEEIEEESRIDTEEIPLASLPFCRKTFLFRFAGLHGQGSELNLLLRLSSLSTHFGYTLLLDSTSWNYGPFSSYFLPLPPTLPLPFPSNGAPSLRCRPPGPSTRRIKVKLTEDDLKGLEKGREWIPGWTEAKHVVWGPQRDMDGLDSTILKLFSNDTQLSTLHQKDLKGLERKREGGGQELGGLSEEESLPEVFGESFERLADEVKRVWKLNEEVEGMVQEAEERLGLSKRVDEEVETKEVGDLVVGVHVRLGDKYLEADRIGPQASLLSNDSLPSNSAPSPYSSSYTAQPGLHESTITNYLAAAIKSINNILSLSPPSTLEPATTSSTPEEQIDYLMSLSKEWASENEEEKPTLILMSDDEGAVSQFRVHPLASRFRVVSTAFEEKKESSEVTAEEDLSLVKKRMAKVIVSKKDKRQLRNKGIGGHGMSSPRHGNQRGHWSLAHKDKKSDGPVIPIVPAGFNENTFNAMPLEERIAQSRLFVRDVTLLSTRSDALVITGSSNVGRLMSLLMGDRARGRVRSLDIRWFPTAQFA